VPQIHAIGLHHLPDTRAPPSGGPVPWFVGAHGPFEAPPTLPVPTELGLISDPYWPTPPRTVGLRPNQSTRSTLRRVCTARTPAD